MIMDITRVEKVMSVLTEGCQYQMSSCNIMVPPPSSCVPLKHSVSTQTFYYRNNFKNKAVQVWPDSTNVRVNTSLKENLPHNRETSLCSVKVYRARKYVVYEDCLLPLFKACPVCHSTCSIDQFIQDTLLTINQTCDHCDHRSQWRSCSFNLPVGSLASLTDASTGPPISFAVHSLENEDNDELQLEYDEVVCNNSLEDFQTLVFETTLCLDIDEENLNDEEDGEGDVEEGDVEEGDVEEGDGEGDVEEEDGEGDVEEENVEEEELVSDKKDSPVLCPDCGTLTKSFKAHVCEHIKPFNCEDCGKRFVNQASLEQHSIVHQTGYVHNCMYCLKSFQNRPEKLRHEESHPRVDKPFTCPHCRTQFRLMSARDKHILNHRGRKRHFCKICKLEFTGTNTLNRHMLVHSKEKPYKCPECERSFNQSGHLKSHMRLHTGERPYKCQHCSKSFNHNVSLKSHVLRYHPDGGSGTKQQENNSETESIQLVDIGESQEPNIETGQERVKRTIRKRKQPTFDLEEPGESRGNTDSENNQNVEGSDSESDSDSEFNPEKGMGSDSDSDFTSEGKKKYVKKRTTGRPKGRPRKRPETTREDQIDPEKKCNIIYEIPCLSCNKTYIGETGRSFSTRKNEHRKECEKETAGVRTRAIKEKAEQENLKSAISDHCKRENHIMNWKEAKIIQTESNKYHRWISEAVEIRKRAPPTVNRDEGAYQLSHTWGAVLHKLSLPSGGRCRGTSRDGDIEGALDGGEVQCHSITQVE
ncbi:hypothetical protein UPYG_G00004750 [Umbra pygmaea]|uniref:C2H2-type domain-containing protein n=1 Tax=Umbra pygmaea TaxID=75934 RepID=A0ABD0XH63_UMBPY